MARASKLFFYTILCALALVMTACNSTFENRTQGRIPQNPSGIYTFVFEANPRARNIVDGSIKAFIVINEQTHPMTLVDPKNHLFAYDFVMPPQFSMARYYYILEYDYENLGQINHEVLYSTHEHGDVYTAHLINRYPIQMVSSRGPVGAVIEVVGRGFSEFDEIQVAGTPATTEVIASNALTFIVPALEAGQIYPVTLITDAGEQDVGNLRIDAAMMKVLPPRLSLTVGDTDLIVVEIPGVAPDGGLYVDVTTDIPESIIMPELTIQSGAQSGSVSIEAAAAGKGSLFFEAPGYEPVSIPVVISAEME